MPDIPISQLPEVTAPAATDVIPIVNGTTTKKVQVANLYAASSGSSLVGFLQAGTGARTGQTVQDAVREVVYADQYGIGDNSTDDYTALQQLISNIQSAGASAQIVFTKLHKIGQPLAVSGATALWLRGIGWNTGLHNTGTGNAVTIGNSSADQTADCRVLDMLIQGNVSSSHGVQMLRMHSSRVERCRINTCGGDGINAQGCYASKYLNNYCNNNTGNGIQLKSLASNQGIDLSLVMMNNVLSNGINGILLDDSLSPSGGVKVLFNDVEGNAVGIKALVGGTYVHDNWTIDDNYFENQVGLNASLGLDNAGAFYLRGLSFCRNTVNTGAGTAAANAVSFGAMQAANISNNSFGVNNVTFASNSSIAQWSGNSGSGSLPGGMTPLIPVMTSLRLTDGTNSPLFTLNAGVPVTNFPFGSASQFYPGTGAAFQTATGWLAGTGVPSNSNGNNGDYYIRSDGGAGTHIYFKSGGTWAGIV